MNNIILQVENLEKKFELYLPEKKVFFAFQNINFNLYQGEFFSISGPSGSGKSSLLKCLYRTYKTTKGSIFYRSSRYGIVDFTKLQEQSVLNIRSNEMSYVSQFLNVIPRISALNLVAEPLIRKNIPQGIAIERAKEMLSRLNIPTNLFDSSPLTFSGGEKQRVNIARAVIWNPSLLLLDEPTASLDEKSEKIVKKILVTMKKSGSTLIGIFHNKKLINQISDRVFLFRKEE
ncbi:ATP-binding cassette domain-containing protein [bacterium]|nr:ATP-binding cassette domain-containing protein [bacterium]